MDPSLHLFLAQLCPLPVISLTGGHEEGGQQSFQLFSECSLSHSPKEHGVAGSHQVLGHLYAQ